MEPPKSAFFPGCSMVVFSVGFSSSMALSLFQLDQGLILSIQIPSDMSQYDVYKSFVQKNWVEGIEHIKNRKMFTLTKYPILHAIF